MVSSMYVRNERGPRPCGWRVVLTSGSTNSDDGERNVLHDAAKIWTLTLAAAICPSLPPWAQPSADEALSAMKVRSATEKN